MDKPRFTAFAGDRRIASGGLRDVLRRTKEHLRGRAHDTVLVFEDETGKPRDFDLRGSLDEVMARAIPVPPAPGPGRPKLGVVSREVSLLERHWEWLAAQPSGSSAAIRRLIDEARKREPERERARLAIEATGRIMTALAGDRAGYEEASRALYAGDWERFAALIGPWPKDVRVHLARRVREAAVEPSSAPRGGRCSPR